MSYVDGFVILLPKKNLARYKRDAKLGKKVWLKHGALDYKECILDDANPQHVSLTFPKLTKAKLTETVVFSFIVFKNRKHRDAVNKKVMADPSMAPPDGEPQMPFDMKRFSYAGFKTLVE